MIWNDYSALRGNHSFLSPSSYSWVNYTPEQLREKYRNHQNAILGTRLHAFAEECIRLKRRQPDTQDPLNQFVNDAIGYRMQPEVILYFSPNAYGTADAIRYDEKDRILRIHDLKTGISPGNVEQLVIYSSLFCLEYGVHPNDFQDVVLRIYQDPIQEYHPTAEHILFVMKKIREFNSIIEELKAGL